MSLILTSGQIAEQALRDISELSPHEGAADDRRLTIALLRLNLLVQEYTSTHEAFWLRDSQIELTVQPGVRTYNLATDTTASTRPLAGIQFIERAELWKDSQYCNPIDIVHRGWYEERDLTTGTPDTAMITRVWGRAPSNEKADYKETVTLYLDPIPSADSDSDAVFTVKMVGQAYTPNIIECEPNTKNHIVGAAWSLWAVRKLAVELGSGSIRWLPEPRIRRLERKLAQSERALETFENMERGRYPRMTKYRDLG